jgi:hypothetical protein
MDTLRKVFISLSVLGVVISVGRYHVAMGTSPFVVRAEELMAETETQKLVKDEANRRKVEMKAALSTERAEFAEQLKSVSSEPKREHALLAADEINSIVARVTDHYIEVTGKLDAIMQAMITKVRDVGATGANVEAVWPKLEEAGIVMGETRGLILSQMGYIYNMEGADEGALVTEVAGARDALYANLNAAREAVQGTRNALADAIRSFNDANKQ